MASEPYNDPGNGDITCPHAKSCMTPCIARDGKLALCDHLGEEDSICVGCEQSIAKLLRNWFPQYIDGIKTMKDRRLAAELFKQMIKNYVEQKEQGKNDEG